MEKTHLLLWSRVGGGSFLTLFDKEELQTAWRRMRALPVGEGLEVCHEITGVHSVRFAALQNYIDPDDFTEPELSPLTLLNPEKAEGLIFAMQEVLPEEESGLSFRLVWNGEELYLMAYDDEQYEVVRLAPPWDDELGRIFGKA